MPKRRAIFLDRDGVINANRSDHVKSWDEFVFLSGALDALRQIAASDFLIIITTNQSAIHRGLVDDPTMREVHTSMIESIERAGGRIDAVYYCPHLPEENCDCRKPKAGLYVQAAEKWDIDLARSYVVGDALVDLEAARAIGSKPILVLSGRGKDQQARLIEKNHSGYEVLDDLKSAVDWIARTEANSGKEKLAR